MELYDKTMDEAHKCGLGFSPSNPNSNNEIHATLDPQFTTDVLCLRFNRGGVGMRTIKDQSFFLNTMANIGPQMIDSTDANDATTRGLFSILKPPFGERFFDKSNKEQRWMQFFANSAWYGPSLRKKWISLQQQHAALAALCEFEKEQPCHPINLVRSCGSR
jgi:hypothetical protein